MMQKDSGIIAFFNKHACMSLHKQGFILLTVKVVTNFMLVYHVMQIPRDILLEVLGPTNVYKEVIKKVIDTTIAEFVEKVTCDRVYLGIFYKLLAYCFSMIE